MNEPRFLMIEKKKYNNGTDKLLEITKMKLVQNSIRLYRPGKYRFMPIFL